MNQFLSMDFLQNLSKKIVTAGLVVGITIVGWDISRYPTLSVLVTRNVNESQMKDPSSMIFS